MVRFDETCVDVVVFPAGADPSAPNAHFLRERVEVMLGKLESLVQMQANDKDVLTEMDNITAHTRKKKIFMS